MPPPPTTPKPMPFEQYEPFQPLPLALADRQWPEPPHRAGAAVVLGRPARRQPGAHRPDGPDPQAAHVRRAREDGLQGDRGRLPVGQPARLRLRAPAHRGGPDPRRRHHPGADPVPARADRAHLRVDQGRAAGHRALLQLHLGAAAARRVRPRQGRHHRHRRQRRPPVPQARGHGARHRRALRVHPRELHRHRDRLRRRDLRGGDGRHRADAPTARSSSTCRPRSRCTRRTSTPT